MISAADEATVRHLVGATTFARAKAYARGGAVRRQEWGDGGLRVAGEVQGGARQPYRVSVELTRSSSARLSSLRAECTCPVGVNCKHAVALLLAGDGPRAAAPVARPCTLTVMGGTGRRPTARVGSGPSRAARGWELALRPLLDGAGPEVAEADHAEVGLYFELVAAATPAGRSPAKTVPRLRLHPVLRTRTGIWARSGISWSSLDYFAYGRSPSAETAAGVGLLHELLALQRASSARASYSYNVEVWLDGIHSRRVWDLFREARDRQVPLLCSTRPGRAVALADAAATAGIDVSRAGAGLSLQPCVEVDGTAVPLPDAILIGRPAHGIAWWDGAGDGAPGAGGRPPGRNVPALHLAPFGAAVDESCRALLEQGRLSVSARDEERFLAEAYPALARRVPLSSRDGSVDLPEPAPAVVVLGVADLGGHRISLSWARGRAGTPWREDLWTAGHHRPEPGAEDAALCLATETLWEFPELVETTAWGERLAASVLLQGMPAARFVAEALPVLAEIPGLEVELAGPLPEYQEASEAPVLNLTGSASRDGDWLDLAVEVTVGGEDVPFHELFVALAEQRSHLILPSGTYFSLDHEPLRHLAELIAEARALSDAPGEGVRLSRFQTSLWEDFCGLGVVTAQAGAWEASVRALSGASERADQPIPETLDATLRPYQEAGFNWLAFLYAHRLGGVLADDMGLGKTLQALALVCHAREQGLSEAPFLVVAPTSVVENWIAECRRFAPDLAVVAITETERRRGVSLAEMAAEVDVVVTSYALFRLEYEDYEAVEWAGLFVDEAQFVKNRQAKTHQQIKRLPAPFKVAMTGTPMENNLMELWALLSITAPGLFPGPDRFEEYYQASIERHADGERLSQLRRRVRPLMLRRTKQQVAADLPKKQEQVIELELNPKHKKLYQTYLARERQKVLGLLGDLSKNRFEIFRSLTLLRQASLDVSLLDPKHAKVPSTKLDALMEMLDDVVAEGHRVLVFSQFTRFLGQVRRRVEAAGIDHCYLDGRTRQRASEIAAFRSGKAPVFLISLKAGGFGLNLTEADYCIILDPWWNPATEAQAVDRIYRIGQTRNVMVYRLVARDTIEEKVMALKAKKAALFANVIEDGGFESGALTAADIRALLG